MPWMQGRCYILPNLVPTVLLFMSWQCIFQMTLHYVTALEDWPLRLCDVTTDDIMVPGCTQQSCEDWSKGLKNIYYSVLFFFYWGWGGCGGFQRSENPWTTTNCMQFTRDVLCAFTLGSTMHDWYNILTPHPWNWQHKGKRERLLAILKGNNQRAARHAGSCCVTTGRKASGS